MIRQLIIPVAVRMTTTATGATIITFDSQEDIQIFDRATLAELRLGYAYARQVHLLHATASTTAEVNAGALALYEAKRVAIDIGVGSEPRPSSP